MTEILQCQYEYPDPYQQYSEPVFTPSQLCSQSLRFLQVHWNRAHTHQATQAHAHPQYVNQPTTSPEQLNPLQIYPRQLNPLPSHPKQSDRLQRHQEQLNPLYAHLEQSIDPRLLFQGTAPKDLVMPSSEPETLVREDITEISPTDEKRKLSGEEQNQHHNESEKTRRNLRRTILEEHLVPLLPQCESACNMAVVWESYRELALRELEKRDRLIAKLEGQGVDVEREFKVTVSLASLPWGQYRFTRS